MAILDFIKKKEKVGEKKKEPARIKKEVKKQEPAKKKETKETPKEKPKQASVLAYRALKEPHISEKATGLTDKDKYVFKVFSEANKFQIKKAIEDLYGVEVVSVNVIKVHRKKRRLGRTEGWRKGYRKAVIQLKKGQKIEVLPR